MITNKNYSSSNLNFHQDTSVYENVRMRPTFSIRRPLNFKASTTDGAVIHNSFYTCHYSDVMMGTIALQITRCLDCLLNLLFRRGTKKTSKHCVTGLCEGEFTGDRSLWRHCNENLARLGVTMESDRWPVNSLHKGQWRGALMTIIMLTSRISSCWFFFSIRNHLFDRYIGNMLSK